MNIQAKIEEGCEIWGRVGRLKFLLRKLEFTTQSVSQREEIIEGVTAKERV